MIALIEEVRKDRDSIGGVCELVATGVPPGLGEPVFDKLKADLAKALLSLPAVTAFEYGAGFARRDGARQRRTTTPFVPQGRARIGTETNRHGGMLGGISQRRADRLPRGDQADEQPAAAAADGDARPASRPRSSTKGRHDPCLLPRFVPMGEAMVALVLVDHWLRTRTARV